MRRTSISAEELRLALAERGFTVTARRIEGWWTAQLNPPDGLRPDARLDHYGLLCTIAGRGIDADVTALRLAVNGFECGRLRGALLRHFRIDQPTPMPRLMADDSDGGFAAVEDAVREMTSTFLDVAPPAFRKVFRALMRMADRLAATHEVTETTNGNDLLVSYFLGPACYLFGGDFYIADNVVAALGTNPADIDPSHFELINRRRVESEDIDRAYLVLPLPQIVVMARMLREWAPAAANWLGLHNLTESETDQICAVLAPMAAHIVLQFRDQLDDSGRNALASFFAVVDGELPLSA